MKYIINVLTRKLKGLLLYSNFQGYNGMTTLQGTF